MTQNTAKAVQEVLTVKKWSILQWPSQSPDLTRLSSISLAEDKTKDRKTHKHTTTEGSCSKNPVSADVHEFQTKGSQCLQKILN